MQVYFNETIWCLLVEGLNILIVPGSLKELLDHDLKLPAGGMGKGSGSKR